MRTLAESEEWVRQQGAVFKVDFSEDVASLQVGAYLVRRAGGAPLEAALNDLITNLEGQMRRKRRVRR